MKTKQLVIDVPEQVLTKFRAIAKDSANKPATSANKLACWLIECHVADNYSKIGKQVK